MISKQNKKEFYLRIIYLLQWIYFSIHWLCIDSFFVLFCLEWIEWPWIFLLFLFVVWFVSGSHHISFVCASNCVRVSFFPLLCVCVCFYPKNLYISHVYDAQHVLVNLCVQIGSINTVVVAAYTNTLALLNFEISIHSMCDHLSVDVYRWTTMKMMMRIILVSMTKCVIEIFVEKKKLI